MEKYVERELVYIEKSSFIFRVMHRIMEGDCFAEHGPILKNVGGFYADKYPVTNKMFFDFLKLSGYTPKIKEGFLKHWENGTFRKGEGNFPVVNISYEDAEAYAKFYSMRLPRDYEWQYLASGEDNLKYPWGNVFNRENCRCDGEGLAFVNTYKNGVSPFGLFDMCGNAWEMTDRIFDGHHSFILLRGGSYYRGENYWHAEGGPMKNQSHLKMLVCGGALDRNGTVSFRCIKEAL